MAEAPRDQNHVTAALFESSTTPGAVAPGQIVVATGRIKTTGTGGGTGTVTDVSVVSANGFAGTVANSTTTPAITLTTTVNSPVLAGNGTAIAAATTTGSGSTVVLSNSPTFNDDITLGVAATATGSILFKGLTSGTVTLSVADIAGTWTMKLPTTDGANGEFLQTDGSGNTTWAAASGSGTVNAGTAGQIAYYAASAAAVSGNANLTISSGAVTIGVAGSQAGTLLLSGGTSGTTTLAVAAATSGTLTLPAATDTLVGKATTDTFTNKTFNTAGSGNVFQINGTGITAVTGSGAVALAGAPTFTSSVTLGVAAGTTGSAIFTGTTSGAVTVKSADAAGTWTLTLPTTDGNANEFLQTNGSGVTTWAAQSTTASLITVANEASDTTCFPVFVTAATGDLAAKSNTGLTFNSSTASLGATLMTATTSLTTASVLASSNDSGAIGASGTAFSDLFLASGAVINFAAGNVTLTHSSGILTQNAGEFRITSANVGTNADSVPTLSSTSTLTNKTLTAPAIGGIAQLAESASIGLDVSLSDANWTGVTMPGTAGATLAFGDIVYLAVADSRWELADASAVSTAGSVMVGFCVLAAAADGDPTRILISGTIRADTAFPTLTVGAAAFISETAGDITNTAPTTTDSVTRVVGHALDGNTLLLNISPDWITHV